MSCAHSVDVASNTTSIGQKYDQTETLTVLKQGALSEDQTIRAVALSGLVTEDASGAWLARALFDPSDWVKRMAVQALDFDKLSEVQTAELIALTGRVNVDVSTRGLVADNLIKSGHSIDDLALNNDPWQQIHLSYPFASQNPTRHHLVVESLSRGRVGYHPETIARIGHGGDHTYLEALKAGTTLVEPEMEVSYLAARAWLGDSGVHDRMNALIKEDPEYAISLLMVSLPADTRNFVVQAAKRIRDPAVDCLIRGDEILDDVERVIGSSDRALCASNASVDAVGKWALDANMVVQIAALRRAWELGVTLPVDVLTTAIKADYPLLRILAARALASK